MAEKPKQSETERSESAVVHPIRTACHDGEWRATERGAEIEGVGETKHDAIIDYVERARQEARSRELVADD